MIARPDTLTRSGGWRHSPEPSGFGDGEHESATGSVSVDTDSAGRQEIVKLCVGGTDFTTTSATIRRAPDSLLFRMCRGSPPAEVDSRGVVYIDRDGRLFHYILNFLRDGSVPIGLSRVSRMELLRETKFYGLKGLYAIAGGIQQPHSPSAVAPEGRGGPLRDSNGPDAYVVNDDEANRRRARSEAAALGYLPEDRVMRQYVGLRYGHEYNGDWIVSSPRNVPGVEYELHGACIARTPIVAMNAMSRAGWRPCNNLPEMPPASRLYTKEWRIIMYKDISPSLRA